LRDGVAVFIAEVSAPVVNSTKLVIVAKWAARVLERADRAARRIEVELKSECPTHTYRSALDHSGGFAASDSRAVTKSLLARWAVGMPGAVLALIEDVNGSGFQETPYRGEENLPDLTVGFNWGYAS
jgi:hypothetical protein